MVRLHIFGYLHWGWEVDQVWGENLAIKISLQFFGYFWLFEDEIEKMHSFFIFFLLNIFSNIFHSLASFEPDKKYFPLFFLMLF
jgi:hypothetical protein